MRRMTLDKWIKESKRSAADLAKAIGVTPEAVRRYVQGLRMPPPIVAQRIVEQTNGQVSIQDLHETRLAYLRTKVAA